MKDISLQLQGSTTLANIFKSDSGNDESVNSSLKYKPPQLKKTEFKSENTKSEDPNASHCVFSCSLIAYEWLEGAHKCKGKVGFAVLKMVKTDIFKMILYSSDKSTLFCITLSPELQVTLKGAMISLYDDHKKYWGLCFNDKNIDKIKEILQQEDVVIKDYESPPAKLTDESEQIDEIETESINIIETNTLALKNDKASILSRIANVGHAILPSTPASPVKKSTAIEQNHPTGTFDSNVKLSAMSDETDTSITKTMHDSTRSIAIQANDDNHEVNNSTVSNNVKFDPQYPLLNLPSHDNQLYPSISRHTVPIPKLVPIITNLECGISASEIGVLINKLTHLQGLVKTMEILETFEKGNNKICPCKDKVVNEPNLGMDSMDSNISEDKIKQNLDKISTLEELIREKDNIILNLQSELKIERIKNNDLLKVDNSTKCLEQQVEDLKQDLIIKNEEFKNMLPRNEVDIMIANIVKKLMNDTFRSLASNFESDSSYSGSNVKGILATVIKKHTVDSLSSLLPNRSSEPAD
ncbi:uncharacterized protein isoform X2 [Choristoneura fumiferana]|uniref:uncharacterized protein isoform X2 n=1 Tax=Choristoneura fumiferana TaxID=7141 RepID=UPI003D15DB9A